MTAWVLLWFRSLSARKSFSLVNVWSACGDRYWFPHLKYWQVMSRALIYWISRSFAAKMVSLVRWQGERGAGNQLCVTIRASQRAIGRYKAMQRLILQPSLVRNSPWMQGRRPNSLLVPQGCRRARVVPRRCAAWLCSGQSPEAAPGRCKEASRDGQDPRLTPAPRGLMPGTRAPAEPAPRGEKPTKEGWRSAHPIIKWGALIELYLYILLFVQIKDHILMQNKHKSTVVTITGSHILIYIISGCARFIQDYGCKKWHELLGVFNAGL